MPYQLFAWDVMTPAGTPPTAPQVTDLNIPVGQLDSVQIKVPPGPQGQLGFALALAGQPVIPHNAGEWIITDDEEISWSLAGLPDSGAWQVITYNAGNYDHTLYIRFLATPAPLLEVSVPTVAAIPAANLSSPADGLAALLTMAGS